MRRPHRRCTLDRDPVVLMFDALSDVANLSNALLLVIGEDGIAMTPRGQVAVRALNEALDVAEHARLEVIP